MNHQIQDDGDNLYGMVVSIIHHSLNINQSLSNNGSSEFYINENEKTN